jgi:DNA-binding transcriptional ArsR family regulator
MQKSSPVFTPLLKILSAILVLTPLALMAKTPASISNLRTSVKANTQRLVFDITGENDPAYYIKKEKQTLNLTLEASLSPTKESEFIKKIEDSRYISSVEFLTLTDEKETVVSMTLKAGVKEDIFSLPSPSRVVIDLKE